MSIVGFADNYCIISVEKHFSQIEFYIAYFATESRKFIRELSQITHLQQFADCIVLGFVLNRFTSSWNYYYESFVSGLSKSLFVSVCVYKGGAVSLTKESYRYPIFIPFVPIRHKEYIYGGDLLLWSLQWVQFHSLCILHCLSRCLAQIAINRFKFIYIVVYFIFNLLEVVESTYRFRFQWMCP